MTSHRPYLLRAMHEWMLDNGKTPYVIVNAAGTDVLVPSEQVKDERIVLNISPHAVRNLNLGNERLEFDARFGGRPFHVDVPIDAVMAVYAKETGEGMAFEPATRASGEPAPPPGRPTPEPGVHLRIVK